MPLLAHSLSVVVVVDFYVQEQFSDLAQTFEISHSAGATTRTHLSQDSFDAAVTRHRASTPQQESVLEYSEVQERIRGDG